MLNAFREREGAATAAEIRQRCENLCELVVRMEKIREGAIPAFQKRLREKLADLLNGAGIEPQRLAQEAALLADRSDIAEELVRLRTHAAHLENLLAAGGEVGKRLDFLLQEMNRESNTVLSKTGGLGDLGLTITDLALAAKSEIDKIREQSLESGIMTTVFIISAPSGSGKSTLVSRLLVSVPELMFSISYTTRKPRGTEVDGQNYRFVSREEFEAMIAAERVSGVGGGVRKLLRHAQGNPGGSPSLRERPGTRH